MKPGWKVYWRSPGDAGFPPEVNWAGSTNFAHAKMEWPAPARFSVLNLETLGYRKEVVFPITASVLEPGKDVALKARVRFLTCDDICVPYEANLTLNLPAGVDINTPQSGTIQNGGQKCLSRALRPRFRSIGGSRRQRQDHSATGSRRQFRCTEIARSLCRRTG